MIKKQRGGEDVLRSSLLHQGRGLRAAASRPSSSTQLPCLVRVLTSCAENANRLPLGVYQSESLQPL